MSMTPATLKRASLCDKKHITLPRHDKKNKQIKTKNTQPLRKLWMHGLG